MALDQSQNERGKERPAQDALDADEPRYRAIFESSRDIILLLELQPGGPAVIRDVNAAGLKAFGYSLDELAGKPAGMLNAAPEDAPAILEKGNVGRPLDGIAFEVRHKRKDGTVFTVEASARELLIGGKRMGISIERDISERKLNEAALRESETRYRGLFDQAGEAIFMLEPVPGAPPVIREANEAALRMHGYTREELIGKPVSFLDTETLLPQVMACAAAITAEKEAQFEGRHRRKDGSTFDIEVSVRELEIGGRRLWLDVSRDITGRKKTERELRDSEELFRKIFEEHAAVKLILDPETGAIMDANEAAVRFYGWPREKFLRMKIQDVNTASPDEIKKRLAQAGSEKRVQFEFRHRRADGSVRDVEVFSSAVNIKGKSLLHSIVHDVTERKKAEAALRDSEAKYRELVENLNDLIFVLDTEGAITYISPQVLQVSGYKPEELVGGSFAKVIHPEDLPGVQRSFGEAVAGRHKPAEFRWRAKDGSIRWARTSAKAILENGRVNGLRGLFSDITERKLAELSVARLATIVHDSYDAIISTDAGGNIRSWSPGAQRLFGYTAAEILGKHISMLATEKNREGITENLDRVNRGETFQYEGERRTKEGATVMVWTVISPIRDAAGAVAGVSGIYRDITERSKAEADKREAYEMQALLNLMLQRSLENIPLVEKLDSHLADLLAAPWLSVEAKGAIFLVDPRGRELLMKASRGLPPALLEKCARVPFGGCLCGRAAAAGTPAVSRDICPEHEIIYEGMQRHGHYCVPIIAEGKVLGVLNLYLREGGTLSVRQEGFVKSVADVMAENIIHSQMEDKFSQAQKMEAIGLLAGGVAHDFNNILTAIKCYTEFVHKALAPEDPKREDTQEIMNSVERAISLTRQLLAFSRRQIMAPQMVDLNKILGGMANMLRRIIGENITLNTSLFSAPCMVKADPGQLEQVVLNLAVNARDAMPDGGTVTLGTEIIRPSEDFFFIRPELPIGPLVCLKVSDTGTGMTEDVKSRLFEPFFTTKEQGKGTGLGLPMVFGIVKQSNGEIEVESEAGKGAAFIIYLPFAEKPPRFEDIETGDGKKDPDAAAALPVRHETVLLVEDEDTLRRLGERVLRMNGYGVLVAANGQAALKLMEERGLPVDLLVTDVVMPGMSGRDLAKELARKNLAGRTLYMSGYTDDAIVKHGVLEPGIAFIYKPFTVEALERKLREVLDGPADKAKA